MNRIKQVISVAIAVTLSITTLKLDKVEANPITAPECRDVPSCVVTGTVVIGGVVYYIIRNTVTGVVRRVPAGQAGTHNVRKNRGSMFPPEENGWVHMPIIPGGGYTRNQCVLLAMQLERERGGKWEPRFFTVDHVRDTGHCSFKRLEDQ